MELSTDSYESRTTTDSGVLDSKQCLTWFGRPLPVETLAALAERMETEHFRAVERSVLGLVRCSVRPDGVDCSIFGVFPVLRFGCPQTAAEAGRISRTWHITGGLQARCEPELGTLKLEWLSATGADGLVQHTLSANVNGFPSRFIPRAGARRPGVIRRIIAAGYARYHGIVTFRYLRHLAVWMHSESAGRTGT